MSILDFIPTGSARAVTAAKIAEIMGIDARAVQTLGQSERHRGTAICASCSEPYGLFIAENVEELSIYCDSLERRLRNIFATYSALRNTLDRMTGQTRFDDYFAEGGYADV